MMSLANYLPDVGNSSRASAPVDPAASSGGTDASAHVGSYVDFRIDDATTRASVMVNEAISLSVDWRKAAHATWSKECQDRVAEEAANARAAFERQVSRNLVNILAPFLEARQRERVRASFVAQLEERLAEMPDVVVVVEGPTEDCKIVAGSLGKIGVTTILRSCEGDGLQAEIGPTIVRADFSKWPAKFAALFGELGRADE